MAVATESQHQTVSGDSPEAIWPWQDDRSDCHCFTLHYGANEGCGDKVPLLPPQLLHAAPKRQAEYIAGRKCAAEAIQRLILGLQKVNEA